MYKYFYNTGKIIYTSVLNEDELSVNDFSLLTANHTANYIRELIIHEHSNIVTVLNEQSNILYNINVNAIRTASLNDNSEIEIIFTDNTNLLFDYTNEGQNNFILKYIKSVIHSNNLESYKIGKTIYRVHSDFDNTGYDYNNIQDCIDAMAAGDYMYVYSGTYAESLSIDKSIDIEFEEGVIINSGASVGLIFAEDVFANIFGSVEVNSETHNITISQGQSVYLEFDSMTALGNYNISGYQGNLILKGNSILNTTERNMYEFSEDKSYFDVLNYVSTANDNLHCNGLSMNDNYSLSYVNARFESYSYNFNIEHAESDTESMTVSFYNCLFYVSNDNVGALSTHTGGTVEPVNVYLHSCYFDTPENTLYDIYTFIGSGGSYGEINLYLLSDVYGKRGMTNADAGLYITEGNGREFIIDSQINIAEII